jgi:hypothetical protein
MNDKQDIFNKKMQLFIDTLSLIEENQDKIIDKRDADNVYTVVKNIMPKAAQIEQQYNLLDILKDKLGKELDVAIPILKSILKP